MTYNQISKSIPCSKGTVSYYCGKNVKKKILKYQQNRRNGEPIVKKLNAFKVKSLYSRGRDFQRRDTNVGLKNKMEKCFTIDELRKHIGDNPKCYLTGRPVDLSDSKSFSLDHFVPVSKGGKNEIQNLRIACSQANFAKSDMLYEEFILLCKEVIKNHESNFTGRCQSGLSEQS